MRRRHDFDNGHPDRSASPACRSATRCIRQFDWVCTSHCDIERHHSDVVHISRGTLGLVLLGTNQAKTAMGSDLGCDIQKPLEKAREVIITRSQFPPYHRLRSLIVLIFVQRTRSLPVSSFFKTEQFGSVSIHPQVQYWCVPRGDGLNSRLTCD